MAETTTASSSLTNDNDNDNDNENTDKNNVNMRSSMAIDCMRKLKEQINAMEESIDLALDGNGRDSMKTHHVAPSPEARKKFKMKRSTSGSTTLKAKSKSFVEVVKSSHSGVSMYRLMEVETSDDVKDSSIEMTALWYQEHCRIQHLNFVGKDGILGPVVVSLLDIGGDFYYFIVRTEKESERLSFDRNLVKSSFFARCCGSENPSPKALLKTAFLQPSTRRYNFDIKKFVHCADGKKIVNDIIKMESAYIVRQLKWGILYARNGQGGEVDLYNNVETSLEFDSFLSFLGERITLNGFKGFRGGLDVKTNTTGDFSIFTVHETYEIMFHVSTLLPKPKGAHISHAAYLERKRHIGNDIVVIVFEDAGAKPFNMDVITSNFNHVFLVIRKVEDSKLKLGDGDVTYSARILKKASVPDFASGTPNDLHTFSNSPKGRKILLDMLILAENACYDAPVFSQKRTRTRRMLLDAICADYL